jgi:hypothetical protein
MKNLLFTGFLSVVLLVQSGCLPCGCSEAVMDQITRAVIGPAVHEEILKANFTFHSPLLGDDTFTFSVTYTNPNPPPPTKTETVSGTYKKSGNTITFKATGGTSTIIQNGVSYQLVCGDKKITLRRPGLPDLGFNCP